MSHGERTPFTYVYLKQGESESLTFRSDQFPPNQSAEKLAQEAEQACERCDTKAFEAARNALQQKNDAEESQLAALALGLRELEKVYLDDESIPNRDELARERNIPRDAAGRNANR